MAIPSFYHPDLCESDDLVNLIATEAMHALKSRRLRVGQAVRLLNGKGLTGIGEIEHAERKGVAIRLTEFTQHYRPASGVTIATAVPKGDRQKVMIDMLTQLGCRKVVPILYEHSVTKFSSNMQQKWQRVAIESCKQSQNPWLPEISNVVELDDLLAAESEGLVYADAAGEKLRDYANIKAKLTVLIGPEGGFSSNEYAIFRRKGLRAISLGPYILRTEAAVVSAVAQSVQVFDTVS